MKYIFILVSFGLFCSCSNSKKEGSSLSNAEIIAVEDTLGKENKAFDTSYSSVSYGKLWNEIENYMQLKYQEKFYPSDFRVDSFDLNQDEKVEYFVYPATYEDFCGGGGCNLWIFANDMKLLSSFTIVEEPIYISLDTVSNGYNDLYLYSSGQRVIKFNGNKYPSNPSLARIVEIDTNAVRVKHLFHLSEEDKIKLN